MDTKDIKVGTKFTYGVQTYIITRIFNKKLLEENSELLFDCIYGTEKILCKRFTGLINGEYKIIE